ncbi:hypothetical protein [Rathayibacter tanaceti]|uniref:HNH endonuclease n=2 Tax=Rathayibacter tanaceti TaxID=1671680 RepID=A0A166IGC2_9MICO|nr:hypothetical protein [Rathayibacter tanaceti]KZX22344.1 hypothetical protein ACH61_00497 [Rathayibacter tanaceti]QHC54616.1 hypothetical protein GSU10_02395 [Rathayibacter tanaceti]TCO37584.1 hypothetical protein EV639_104254 [Rathayibacter tanaceti]
MTTADWHDLFVPTLMPDAPAGHVRMRADVLPPQVFGSNVRKIARESEWDRIRLGVSARAGKLCQICGGESYGPYRKVQHPDCHEIWRFEERSDGLTQVLAGLIALCKTCHNTQHIGRAPDLDQVMEVLMGLNGWTREEARAYVQRAFARLKLLRDVEIHLDLSLLVGQIVVPSAPDLLFTSAGREALGPSWKPSGPATRRCAST